MNIGIIGTGNIGGTLARRLKAARHDVRVANSKGAEGVRQFAGALDESWRQQPSTPAYCCDRDAPTMRAALAAEIRGEAAGKRDRMPEQFATLGADPRHEDVVAMNRAANAVDGFHPQ